MPQSPSSEAFISVNLPPALAERYELIKELGCGAEAAVWCAKSIECAKDLESGKDITTEQLVAIKLFTHTPTYSIELGTEKYRNTSSPLKP